MSRRTLLLALIPSVAFTGCHTAKPLVSPIPVAATAPTPLRAPWSQSPAPTNQPYACTSIALAPDITNATPRRRMRANSDDAYIGSATALEDFARSVTEGADAFRKTGNLSAAKCVVSLLDDAAMHHGMDGDMPGITAWKEQSMTLRAASLAWLEVRDANVATPDQADLIDAWMEDIVGREIDYFSHAYCARDGCAITGHTGVGVAVSAAAIGVAAQNHQLFDWSMRQFYDTVDRINDNGMIQWDIQHSLALKYNLLSAAGLVQVAEFGEANGLPLYNYDKGRLQLLVKTVTRALTNPEPFQDASDGATQTMPPKIESWEIAWANAYNRHFPDPVIESLLQQAGSSDADTWGHNPWDIDYARGRKLGF